MAVKQTRCKHPGCTSFVSGGDSVCTDHKKNGARRKKLKDAPSGPIENKEPENVVIPIDEVSRMTSHERLSLVAIETECMNFILQLRIHDLEVEILKYKHQQELQTHTAHRLDITRALETKKIDQQRIVYDIAKKYELDPKHMSYDPETGVLRDLRESKES